MDPEDLMKIAVSKDPWDDRLCPITKDKCTRGGMPAWVIRGYNCDKDTKNAKTGQ